MALCMQIERGTGADGQVAEINTPSRRVFWDVFGRVEPFLRHCCREDIEMDPQAAASRPKTSSESSDGVVVGELLHSLF